MCLTRWAKETASCALPTEPLEFCPLKNPLSKSLPLAFYERPALTVAPALLGQVLVHTVDGVRRAGRIVETEAYIGPQDLASHASKGRTGRTEVMFGPPGHAYVYLIYGMYNCFNVVVEPEGFAAAVLVRGLEPLEGLGVEVRTDGPGKLCRALAITRVQNRASLRDGTLRIEPGEPVLPEHILTGPRIGVAYAKEWALRPYRFWVDDDGGSSNP